MALSTRTSLVRGADIPRSPAARLARPLCVQHPPRVRGAPRPPCALNRPSAAPAATDAPTPAPSAPAPSADWRGAEGTPLSKDEAASLRRVLAAGAGVGAAADSSTLSASRAGELAALIRSGLEKSAEDLSELEGAILAAEQVSKGCGVLLVGRTCMYWVRAAERGPLLAPPPKGITALTMHPSTLGHSVAPGPARKHPTPWCETQ
jgi:hypothetical protein